MKLFQSNIQTSVLVLLVILLGIVCVTLFFTNKEVRHLKTSVVKNQHDIEALQNLLSDVGMKATGSMNEVPSVSFQEPPLMNTDSLHPNNIVPHNNPPNSPLSSIDEVPENTDTPTEEVVPAVLEEVGSKVSEEVGSKVSEEVVPKNDVEEVKSDSDSEGDSDSDSDSESDSEDETENETENKK
jgi:hypothetical protein